MRIDTITTLNYFCLVAETKSFTKAATQLNLSASALSQAIRSLEKNLATRLLHRTTRSVSLTEAGLQLYSRIKPTLGEIDHILDEIKQLQQTPSGLLKITTSHVAWQAIIAPNIDVFTQRYPEIILDIQITDGLIDLVTEGFDLGIRSSRTLHDSMIAMPIGKAVKSYIVASPNYLRSYGIPTRPEELNQHQCIGYRFQSSQQLYQWEFSKNKQSVKIALAHPIIVNSEEALLQLALKDMGLAYVFATQPVNQTLASGRLISVLEDWLLPMTSQFYLYYPNRQFISYRTRAFIDFFKSSD